MSFKGEINLNGRPKGSRNKLSIEVRKTIANIIADNQSELYERMSRLSDPDFCKYYIQLCRYVLPPLRGVEDAPRTFNEEIKVVVVDAKEEIEELNRLNGYD
jgi:hypothetical protein